MKLPMFAHVPAFALGAALSTFILAPPNARAADGADPLKIARTRIEVAQDKLPPSPSPGLGTRVPAADPSPSPVAKPAVIKPMCPSNEPKAFVAAFAKSAELQKAYVSKPLKFIMHEVFSCAEQKCPPDKTTRTMLKTHKDILVKTKYYVDLYSIEKLKIPSIFPMSFDIDEIKNRTGYGGTEKNIGEYESYTEFTSIRGGFVVKITGEGESPEIKYIFLENSKKCWILDAINVGQIVSG
jgi:hypothetical protein